MTRFWDASLSAKITVALSVALLPLGMLSVAGAWSSYRVASAARNVGFLEAASIAAPALMWMAALVVASAGLNRLLRVPLRGMVHVAQRYAAGDTRARISEAALDSPELIELASAFNTVADRVEEQRRTIEEALVESRALTREVHHRVKNNLQIVSSLLSLQARDAVLPGAVAAYDAIRERVNALALVHRWMYQGEASQGVELRPLIAELCASLEHGFDGRAPGGRVSCETGRLIVGQDTALPVAFLVTELVGGARRHCPSCDVHVGAKLVDGRGKLEVRSASFQGATGLDAFETGRARIIQGLSRQLRSPLTFQADQATFSITFPERAPEPAA